jgi:hypothetical protein
MSRVDVATDQRFTSDLGPFTPLPSALFEGSQLEPGARWGLILAGAAISLTVSGSKVRPSG